MVRSLISFPALALAASVAMAGAAKAEHFEPLSPGHTDFGVSQFSYGNVPIYMAPADDVLKVVNPNHVDQVAAFLIYESVRGEILGRAGAYAGCVVRELAPHHSIAVAGWEFFGDMQDEGGVAVSTYVESIWAPIDEVGVPEEREKKKKKKKRKDKDLDFVRTADGLGGTFEFGGFGEEPPPRLAHPAMFSLPTDVADRSDAIDCVMRGLADLDTPRSDDLFADFGIF